jgi:tripartite-type tricarboxylate transporter receptor subunit TctC
MDSLVAAGRGTDGPRTADVSGLRDDPVVLPLPELLPDRMDGGHVEHVEAHLRDARELGFDILAAPWYGLEGPKGVPAEIAEEMAKAVAEVLKDPANQAKLKGANYEPKTSTPAEFAKTIKDEVATWGPVIRKYNLYVD